MSDTAIEIVDAFAEEPFRGNAAAIVREAAGLTDAQMQAIAREMNLGATAFLVQRRPGEWDLRWFTPVRELTLCGHATIASAHALREAGLWKTPRATFQTLSGPLTVEVAEAEAGALYWLTLPIPSLTPFAGDKLDIARALAIKKEDLRQDLPWALTPERDLLIPASGLAVVQGLRPDPVRLGQAGEREQVRGFCVFTTETRTPDAVVHSRFFAPHYGIPEDPVTGSVHGPLAAYLRAHGLLKEQGHIARGLAEQGDALGRPGRLYLELMTAGGEIMRARVGGRAAKALRGRIEVPERNE